MFVCFFKVNYKSCHPICFELTFPLRILQILYWLWSVSELVPWALRWHLAEWGRAHWRVRLSTVPVNRGCHDGAHAAHRERLWGSEEGAAFFAGESHSLCSIERWSQPAWPRKHFWGLTFPVFKDLIIYWLPAEVLHRTQPSTRHCHDVDQIHRLAQLLSS